MKQEVVMFYSVQRVWSVKPMSVRIYVCILQLSQTWLADIQFVLNKQQHDVTLPPPACK